jgi:hypothetical protein
VFLASSRYGSRPVTCSSIMSVASSPRRASTTNPPGRSRSEDDCPAIGERPAGGVFIRAPGCRQYCGGSLPPPPGGQRRPGPTSCDEMPRHTAHGPARLWRRSRGWDADGAEMKLPCRQGCGAPRTPRSSFKVTMTRRNSCAAGAKDLGDRHITPHHFLAAEAPAGYSSEGTREIVPAPKTDQMAGDCLLFYCRRGSLCHGERCRPEQSPNGNRSVSSSARVLEHDRTGCDSGNRVFAKR